MSKIDDELDEIERERKLGVFMFLKSPLKRSKQLLIKIKHEYSLVQKIFAYIIMLNISLGSIYLFSYDVMGNHIKTQQYEIEILEKNKCNCITNNDEIIYFDCDEDIPSKCQYEYECRCIDPLNKDRAYFFSKNDKLPDPCIEKSYSEQEVLKVLERSDVLIGLSEGKINLDYRDFGLTYQELFLSLIFSLLCFVGIKIF